MAERVCVSVRHADGPVDGLVLRWRKARGVLSALVTYELDGRIVTEWVPAMTLTPADDGPGAETVEADEAVEAD